MTTDPNIPASPSVPAAETHSIGGLTPEQIRTMAEWAVEDGQLTRAQADEALKADGLEPPAPPDPSIDPVAAAEIDAAFPPAKPEEFQLPKFAPEGQPISKEVVEFDRNARGWLASAEFTRELGSAVASEVNRVSVQVEKMSAVDRELWKRGQQQQLHRLWKDAAPAKLELAQRFIKDIEAKSKGVVEALELTGAGDSAFVIAQVALQAERYYAKRRR